VERGYKTLVFLNSARVWHGFYIKTKCRSCLRSLILLRKSLFLWLKSAIITCKIPSLLQGKRFSASVLFEEKKHPWVLEQEHRKSLRWYATQILYIFGKPNFSSGICERFTCHAYHVSTAVQCITAVIMYHYGGHSVPLCTNVNCAKLGIKVKMLPCQARNILSIRSIMALHRTMSKLILKLTQLARRVTIEVIRDWLLILQTRTEFFVLTVIRSKFYIDLEIFIFEIVVLFRVSKPTKGFFYMCFVQNSSRFLFRSIWLSDLWFFLYSYIFIVLIKKIFHKNSDIYRIEKVIFIRVNYRRDDFILF